MRRLVVWSLLAGVVSFALAAPAFAVRPGASQNRAEISSPISPTVSGTVVKSVRGALVHSMTLVCPTAPCEMAIFDVASAVDTGDSAWEARAASNDETITVTFPVPLVTDSGLNVQVSSDGTGFIAYE